MQGHDDVRDAMAYKVVVREPVVREADDKSGIPSLIADLGIRGVWQLQSEALFDIRVTDTDAQSPTLCLCHVYFCSRSEEEEVYICKQWKHIVHLSLSLLS